MSGDDFDFIKPQTTPTGSSQPVPSATPSVAIKGGLIESASIMATIGEMAVLDQSVCAATATAKTKCKLLAVNRKALINIVKTKPAIGMAMMRSVSARLHCVNALVNA